MLNHTFNLRYSKYQLLLSIFLLAASCLIVTSVDLPLLIKLTLIMTIMIYGFYLIQQPFISIRRINKDNWEIQTKDAVYIAVISGDSTVTPIVSILRFRVHGSRSVKSLVIFPDALGSLVYRQLLGCLR